MAPTASAHTIEAPAAEFGGTNGIYGWICGHKGVNTVNHGSGGWNAWAETWLQVGIPCWYNPGGGCCAAGTVQAAVIIQRANGSVCPEYGSGYNNSGTYHAWAYIFGGCGSPASGSKRTWGTHRVVIYGTEKVADHYTAFHPSI